MEKKISQVYSEVLIQLANQLDLTSTHSEQVYKTLLEIVAQTLEAEPVSIWRLTRSSMEMQCVAVHGCNDTWTPRDPIDLSSNPPYLTTLQTEFAIPVPNLIKDQRFAGLSKEFWIVSGIQSSLHVPIRVANKLQGLLRLDSRSRRDWTEEEVQFCCQVGNLISHVFFTKEIESVNRQMDTFVNLVKRLTSVTSSLNRLVALEDIIPMIGHGAVRLANAEKLAIILRERDGIVRAPWVFGLVKSEMAKVIERDGSQLLGLFKSTEPVFISKVSNSQLPPSIKTQLAFEGVTSARVTPITHSENVRGLIAAFDETCTDWPCWEMEAMETFANTASLALQNIWLYDQLERGYLDLALSLANTVDARESGVRTASMRLAEWCQQTAQLLGLSEEEQRLVRWAALLHDIGKAEIPDEILRKPGPLNAAERKMLEQYPLRSEKLLSPSSRYRKVGKVLRNIHERFDGKGYPDKKKGEDIPLPARILAVADAYGSMIDNRPYRQAHSQAHALQEIMKNSGTQFDPAVVNAFLQTVSNQEMIH